MIAALTAIADFIVFLVKTYFPKLLAKYGIVAVLGSIRKVISAAVITTTIAFYTAMLYFITTAYNMFHDLSALVSNPTSSSLGAGSEWVSCFLTLLSTVGITAGVTAALPFAFLVLTFIFSQAVYKTTLGVLKTVSDEFHKASNLYVK